jgi:hypothetical protein
MRIQEDGKPQHLSSRQHNLSHYLSISALAVNKCRRIANHHPGTSNYPALYEKCGVFKHLEEFSLTTYQ